MILGISGSPRANGITANAVKNVLKNCIGETKYISLEGKHIGGCTSCLGCTKDNKCVVQDDFQSISDCLIEADAIVLGVPNYYGLPNGLTHCLLERCFCFRHQGAFLLKNKPVVLISTGHSRDEENNIVLKIVDNFIKQNRMTTIMKFLVEGYSQCYDCEFGRTCVYGSVVNEHGVVEKITPAMLPSTFDKQPESVRKCEKAASLINDLLKG